MRSNLIALALLGPLAIGLSACGGSSTASHAARTPARVVTPRSAPAATSTTSRAPDGPTAIDIVHAEIEAFNRGDVAGAVALFAPDAVFATELGGCTPCLGRDAVRDHWSRAIASQTTIGIETPTMAGDVVTARAWLKSPSLPDGVTRAVGTLKASVRAGKITRWEQTYDLSDPQTAKLFAAVGLATTTTAPR